MYVARAGGIVTALAVTTVSWTSLLLAALGSPVHSLTIDHHAKNVMVPTGQIIKPAGRELFFYGRPVDLALHPTQDILAIKTSHGLIFTNSRGSRVLQTLNLTREHVDYPQNLGGNGFLGLIWTDGGKTIWSPDGYGLLRSAIIQHDGTFKWAPDIELPGPTGVFRDPKTHELDPSAPTGLAMGPDRRTLFVALSVNNSVAAVDIASRRVVYQIRVGVAPFAILRVGGQLFVSNLGGARPKASDASSDSGGTLVKVDAATGIADSGTVSVINVGRRRVVKEIAVGLHPEMMELSQDGRQIYVANANADSISVVDLGSDSVVDTIRLSSDRDFGAAPAALAVSPVDGNLYVAEGGRNRVEIIDKRTYRSVGEIPTAWYPDAIAFGRDGSLFIADLKGVGSLGKDLGFKRPELGLDLYEPKGAVGYNVYDYAGVVQFVADPRGAAQSQSFAAVGVPPTYEARYRHSDEVPVPIRPGQRSVFKHVIYIIKENHTYDDYFGDMERGNGDKKLCVFPRSVTPNHHAVADRFGLFDNFYVSGIMSADGHQWTDEAMATDYVERNISSWVRSYPSDGTDALAYAASGFIWNRVLNAGLTFRDYGEFVPSQPFVLPRRASWIDFYRDYTRHTHTVHFRQFVQLRQLGPYVNFDYPGFTQRISDQARADAFLEDLRRFERSGTMPNLMLMLLGNDHTAGTTPDYPTPRAAVADNDLALGRIISAITHSRYWKDTVIFVVEDDAQNGLDHVDGHRTMALVASAYNRPHAVDSSFYNQTSIVRTIELIFNLRPMTLFDANAPPIVAPFRVESNLTPYEPIANSIPLDELNPKPTALTGKARYFAMASARQNFDAPDSADPKVLSASIRYFMEHATRLASRAGRDEPVP